MMALAARLLGAHIGGRAEKVRAAADLLVFQRESEVHEVWLARRVEQDVGRLDVAVEYPLFVRVLQRVGHRRQQPHRLDGRERALLHAVGQRTAGDELRNNVAATLLVGLRLVDSDNVRMVQARQGPGFLEICADAAGGPDDMLVRRLDRDGPVEPVVVGLVHDTV